MKLDSVRGKTGMFRRKVRGRWAHFRISESDYTTEIVYNGDGCWLSGMETGEAFTVKEMTRGLSDMRTA